MARLVCVIIAVLAPLAAAAQSVTLHYLTPIGDLALLEPASPPPPGGPKIYDTTGPHPNWSIGQWNIPDGALSAFKESSAGGAQIFSANAPEASVRMVRQNGETQVNLAQDGTVLPCDSGGTPRESDLFLGPFGSDAAPPAVSALPLQGTPGNPSLDKLANVVLTAKTGITEGISAKRKGCPVDQGFAMVGIILNDTAVKPYQTLFYQLNLSQLCGIQPAVRAAICHGTPTHVDWFFKTNPYGVSDYLPLLGQPYMRGQESVALKLVLLPRLEEAVKQGPPGTDHNLAHWVIGHMYVGQAIWGDVTLRTSWTDVRLTGYPR